MMTVVKRCVSYVRDHAWGIGGAVLGVVVMLILIAILYIGSSVHGVVSGHNADLVTIKRQTTSLSQSAKEKAKLDNEIRALVAYGDSADSELRNLATYLIESNTASCQNAAMVAQAAGHTPVACPVLPTFAPLPPLPTTSP